MAFKLEENERYYFDEKAAERPVKFIESYLFHSEDRYAGKPFLLMDWQRTVARNLFGWKRREDNRRRFRELYLEIAKGNGKSPFLAALGVYYFFAEKYKGQQIFSIASDVKQAKITFDFAKAFILASPKLKELIHHTPQFTETNYPIVYPRKRNKWEVVSGTAKGKHGFRPNVIIADELHEWESRKIYDFITSNLFKRSEPLLLVATNSGASRDTICWERHENAMRVLDGSSKDETLYPCIYAADKDDDWSLPATWAKANPAIGETITIDDLRTLYVKAKSNGATEANFRRLHLSQWVQGADKWLNMSQWDDAVGKPKEDLSKLPLYLGMDLSQSDDFSSIAGVWKGKDKLYAKVWTYCPRASAYNLEDKESLPITDWVADKHLRLLESDTVDEDAHKRFAKLIARLQEKYQLKTLGYDSYRANLLVARLEKQGVTCVPVKQSYEGIGGAAAELERRLKAGTIVVPDNPCLRWQAANVECRANEFGSIRPVKESAKGRYAGRRTAKIDGILSIVIALAEVLKSELDTTDNAFANWDGKIFAV
jgi:phage terminase large subunit-like protein